VASNSKCSWTVVNTNAWITLTDNTNGTGSSTVGYSIAANHSLGARTGALTIGGQPFTIIQLACAFTVSPANLDFDAGPGAGQISVTTTGMCPWSVVNPNSWITPNASTDPNGN